MASMAKKRQPYGGYDQEFISEVAERFICQICTKVLAEPHLAVCCGQHFCESCLNEWLNQEESCPHCRAEGEDFNHVINKGLRSEISQLKVRCSNWKQGKGCDWIGELGQLKHHLESENGCGFVFVSCPNKCGEEIYGFKQQFKRMDLNQHLRLKCILRPHECEHCGFQDTYYAITGEGLRRARGRFGWRGRPRFRPHYDTCPELPLICPNKCGVENIKRIDMKYHQMECPLEKIECPFLEAGCKDEVVRSQLDEHLASNQQAHTLMMMKDYKKTKYKLRETEELLSSAVATIKLLQGGTDATKDGSSLIIDHSQRLSKEGDFVKIIVPKLSKIAQSGRIWHSPPFYYRAGYKLCLALLDIRKNEHRMAPNSYSIESVALCILKGEYDHQLVWPMQECSDATGHLRYLAEEFPGDREEKVSKILARGNFTRFGVCSSLLMQDRPVLRANKPVELQKIDHLRIPTSNIHCANDCLMLKVVGIYGGCALQVDVIV